MKWYSIDFMHLYLFGPEYKDINAPSLRFPRSWLCHSCNYLSSYLSYISSYVYVVGVFITMASIYPDAGLVDGSGNEGVFNGAMFGIDVLGFCVPSLSIIVIACLMKKQFRDSCSHDFTVYTGSISILYMPHRSCPCRRGLDARKRELKGIYYLALPYAIVVFVQFSTQAILLHLAEFVTVILFPCLVLVSVAIKFSSIFLHSKRIRRTVVRAIPCLSQCNNSQCSETTKDSTTFDMSSINDQTNNRQENSRTEYEFETERSDSDTGSHADNGDDIMRTPASRNYRETETSLITRSLVTSSTFRSLPISRRNKITPLVEKSDEHTTRSLVTSSTTRALPHPRKNKITPLVGKPDENTTRSSRSPLSYTRSMLLPRTSTLISIIEQHCEYPRYPSVSTSMLPAVLPRRNTLQPIPSYRPSSTFSSSNTETFGRTVRSISLREDQLAMLQRISRHFMQGEGFEQTQQNDVQKVGAENVHYWH